MADTTIKEEILNEIDKMTPERQMRVLEFARTLSNPLPPGVPGKDLLQFAGILTHEEGQEWLDAIEEKDVSG